MRRLRRGRAAIPTSLVLALGACTLEGTFDEPDPDLNRMLEQPRYDAYERGPFLEDNAVLQRAPEGTVPWRPDAGARADDQGQVEVTRAMLERGRDRFETHCAACHGVDGRGDTVVASFMNMRPPPSLHNERIRELSDAELLRVVREGFGVMRSYAAQLDRDDRRAVVAYLRALQLSRHARVAELPQTMQRELKEQAR